MTKNMTNFPGGRELIDQSLHKQSYNMEEGCNSNSTLINFWSNWVLLTPFLFIWVFQILIGYSKFLRNAYLRILLFFNWVFS